MTDPLRFQSLWSDAEAIWNAHETEPAFQGYVSADYAMIYAKLLSLRSRATTFLEWGSGLGVVSIMASLLGFDSYGIEVEPRLVHFSQALAEKHGAELTIANGSFIPLEFEPHLDDGDEFHRTVVDDVSAYEELDMQLRDFDLVYAYPWPEELHVFRSIMRRCAAPNTLFLRYDAREGLLLSRPAKRNSWRH
ncbi:MAG: hypothetical protein R3C53_02095 [Pirellulaceae bacterium]